MSQSQLEPTANTAEDKFEWDAFATRVKVDALRRQWKRGLAILKLTRMVLVVCGVVTFVFCATPFLADLGQRLPTGPQLYLDAGLLLSAAAVLAPVWMKANFTRFRGEITKLDNEEKALGTAGLKLWKQYEEAQRKAKDKS
ncbi:hypothetical protein PTKU64_80610 [Paraburkholderia terrae]|uniref:DUF4231 domain-containing protein n=2 Tax=Paraburkholderia terrae TaxID=311230 RepID=A0ABN6JTR7_9BURK|nr:hypothetical protein PTKU64_80610 [Paraburkholderia terrae]BDC45643.1 hypothetical protein PTKU15_89400 [Paraburkholderia terrae]